MAWQSRWRNRDPVLLSFMLVTFITGAAVALMVPVLSLFLADELGVRPLLVGLFYTVNAVAGILISQWLAKRSDRQGSRKRLIVYCCLAGLVAGLLFAGVRHYWLLITLGVLLLNLASTASPQMFALARVYCDHQGRRAVMFSTLMRAQFSLAWVVGPPLAFAVVAQWGFVWLFIGAGLTYLLCGWTVQRRLPDLGPASGAATGTGDLTSAKTDVRWLFVGCLLVWTCNSMYLISMPLYLTRQLGFEQSLVGWLMGTAAGLEIPLMLMAGHWSARWGKRPMMRLAGLAGVVFYGLLPWLTHPAALIGVQLFNAILIGIVAGLGMSYFQDLMPGARVAAPHCLPSAVRTGSIAAGALAGVIAETWGYQGVFWLAILLAGIACFCFGRVANS
ncbi:MAG: sugar efflux transporter [Aeromonadaceae bacterium]|nr:sugar efflux transporter [Aeromonadaceae bacterium]